MESNPNVSLFNFLTQQITLYFPLVIITIGTIGCFCNFITFTSPKLRKNSCSFYFLAAALFDLLTLDFGQLTRLLADHFGSNSYNQSQIYCKIRQYLVNVLPAIATSFIVLAATDRFMCTSSKLLYRSFATIKCVKWIIPLDLIICILSYLHYLIYTDLRPTCSLQPGAYGTFSVVYSIVWTSIIPHFLMLYFGFGTHWHMRRARRRVLPINNQQRRVQRTEIHMITMMLFQVGISSLLILTRITYFSYNTITTGTQKTDYQTALEAFFAQLTTQLFYLNYAKSFYIYTLSSKYFRKIFAERMVNIYHKLIFGRRQNMMIHQQNLNIRVQTLHMRRSLENQ